jgi:hypothetical protein
MRIKRGTLSADKEGGRLYVLLTPDPTTEPTDRTSELIAELRDRVRSLEGQLDQERTSSGELRRIVAALTQRIPEIEAPSPSEPPESPESPADEQQGRGPLPDHGGPQESPQRPWWRRIFEG